MSHFDKPNPSTTACPWCGYVVNPSMATRWDLTPWLGDRVMHFSCVDAIENAARTLAHNLAIAAALQRAFMLGFWLGHEAPFLSGDEVPEEWQPGRGKAAP